MWGPSLPVKPNLTMDAGVLPLKRRPEATHELPAHKTGSDRAATHTHPRPEATQRARQFGECRLSAGPSLRAPSGGLLGCAVRGGLRTWCCAWRSSRTSLRAEGGCGAGLVVRFGLLSWL